MKTQYLIIGAGLSGIVLAQQLAEQGKEVLIVEKRNHIGGNCYDYYDENGFLIHQYGPHIFHTDMKEVWQYIQRFSEFTNFQLRLKGFLDGQLLPIPFNFTTMYLAFPPYLAQQLEETLLTYYPYNSKISIGELREKAEQEQKKALSFLADYIFEKIFKQYTMKQRGISAEEINPEVMKRVPILISRDDRYFPHHQYQGMPAK
jgi:UDP-galactopyranose mutase